MARCKMSHAHLRNGREGHQEKRSSRIWPGAALPDSVQQGVLHRQAQVLISLHVQHLHASGGHVSRQASRQPSPCVSVFVATCLQFSMSVMMSTSEHFLYTAGKTADCNCRCNDATQMIAGRHAGLPAGVVAVACQCTAATGKSEMRQATTHPLILDQDVGVVHEPQLFLLTWDSSS